MQEGERDRDEDLCENKDKDMWPSNYGGYIKGIQRRWKDNKIDIQRYKDILGRKQRCRDLKVYGKGLLERVRGRNRSIGRGRKAEGWKDEGKGINEEDS